MNALEILDGIETVITVIAMIILGLSAVLTIIRMSKGPTSLDRVMSLDLLTGIVIGVIALWITATGLDLGLTIMLVLSVTSFIGAASMPRFMHDQAPNTADGSPRRSRRKGRRGIIWSSSSEDGAPAAVFPPSEGGQQQ